ncbi:hypothetical protein ACIF70_18700 [Actinacidiphila glaucinigra]|uniref:hypothetical protein n=1 Tax=Actinacidiphila glaucinigra TaxID=235986 RepID=UPI0037C7CCB1
MTTGDDARVFAGHWVFETNLRPLCEAVAHFTGYAFDDWDRQAIDGALPATDAERRDGWYAYPLAGRVPLTLFVAGDPGSAVVFVRFAGEAGEAEKARIEAALHIFSTWAVP